MSRELLIGSKNDDSLVIRVDHRAIPDSEDYWDGNWLDCTVSITAGRFTGRYGASFRTDDFSRFRQQLRVVYDTLRGEAVLSSMEDWLEVRVTGDGRGHLEAKCEARDEAGIGNVLRFRLRFDQTDVPSIVSAIDGVLEEFPTVGRRDV